MEPEREARYERARRQVEALRAFYGNLGAYILVNLALFLIDMVTAGGPWFYWPLLGWGIGVAAHAVSVFGFSGAVGKAWEERKIRELMERSPR